MKKTIALGAAALIVLTGCTSAEEPAPEAPETSTSTVISTSSTPTAPPLEESDKVDPPAPEETTEPLPVPPDSYICGDPSLHQPGTTFYFDGTTGWTQECSDLMRSQFVPQTYAPGPVYDEAPPFVPAEPYYESSGEAQFDHGCAAGYIDPAICNAQ